jgi:hypothetical protein
MSTNRDWKRNSLGGAGLLVNVNEMINEEAIEEEENKTFADLPDDT